MDGTQNNFGLDLSEIMNGGGFRTVSMPIGDGSITMPASPQSKTPGEVFDKAWKAQHPGDPTVMSGVAVDFSDWEK